MMDRDEALKAAFAAEKVWEKELKAAFGKDARHARYEGRGAGAEGSSLRRAYIAHVAATQAWRQAVEAAK